MNYNNFQTVRKLASPSVKVDRFVQTKPLSSLPDDVLKQVKLISLNRQEEGIPFGSYLNRIADYFGDIDVIQLVDKFKSADEIGPKVSKAIQTVIKRILKEPDHWISEVKAGIDKTYFIPIGTLSEGVYKPSDNLKHDSYSLFASGYLDKDEYDTIDEILQKGLGDGDDYDMIFNIFRKHYVLRWDQDEILQGYKVLPSGIHYKLSEAVLDRSAVKIDMIVFFKGKYIEITNFMAITYNNEPVNGDPGTPKDLPIEIEKLYYSNYYYKPFKMVKRCFAYLKWLRKHQDTEFYSHGFTNEELDNVILKYANILKKSINILYTINSEIDAMSLIKDKLSSRKIKKRLNELKQPLANVLELPDEMLQLLNGLLDSEDSDLDYIHDLFNEIIDRWTIAYFKAEGINPPPKIVLPQVMSYDPNIVRD
jgi:hypothetical protein